MRGFMDTIIELKDVSFDYHDERAHHILDHFNLTIQRGSFTVILGHNGSGKSTLAKLFNGLYKPSAGQVLVDGMATDDEQYQLEIKRRVGLVFQNPDNQLVSSVVEEDVAFGPENLGLEPQETRQRVDEALKIVGMYEKRFSAPHNLSGGQKQRIAIAGILAMKPECIVLDEPTAMLDPVGRREVLSAITRLNREYGITILLITHFMEEAEPADRVLVLNNGVVTADATPSDLFSEIDLLREAGLTVPQTTLILDKLRQNGIPAAKGVISVDACVDEVYRLLHANPS